MCMSMHSTPFIIYIIELPCKSASDKAGGEITMANVWNYDYTSEEVGLLQRQLREAEKNLNEQAVQLERARKKLSELDTVNEKHQQANYELIAVIKSIQEEMLRELIVYAVVAHDKETDCDMCLGVSTAKESASDRMRQCLLDMEGVTEEEINTAIRDGEYISDKWTLSVCETTIKGL